MLYEIPWTELLTLSQMRHALDYEWNCILQRLAN